MKKSIVVKIILYAAMLMVCMFLVDLSFCLMNMDSTVAFVCGILLLLASVGLPVEYVIKKSKVKK